MENFKKIYKRGFYFKIRTQFFVYNNCAFDRFISLLDKTTEIETDR